MKINFRKNQEKSLFGISIKNFGASVFFFQKKLKNEIPNITNDILNFEKENRDEIKNYIISKIDNYTELTFQNLIILSIIGFSTSIIQITKSMYYNNRKSKE